LSLMSQLIFIKLLVLEISISFIFLAKPTTCQPFCKSKMVISLPKPLDAPETKAVFIIVPIMLYYICRTLECKPHILPRKISTKRLIIRKPTLEDAPTLFAAYTQYLEVVKYLTWTPHQDIVDTSN